MSGDDVVRNDIIFLSGRCTITKIVKEFLEYLPGTLNNEEVIVLFGQKSRIELERKGRYSYYAIPVVAATTATRKQKNSYTNIDNNNIVIFSHPTLAMYSSKGISVVKNTLHEWSSKRYKKSKQEMPYCMLFINSQEDIYKNTKYHNLEAVKATSLSEEKYSNIVQLFNAYESASFDDEEVVIED